jgi:pSer/pThr/pTyr-binding forkhead associated (FHA) protein
MSVAMLRLRLAGTGDEELLLNRQELTIGRALDNDLILNDAAVSLHHARIAKIQDLFYIEDLGSTNNTFVNEQRTDEQPLTPGDQIRIGDQVLIFEQAAADTADVLAEPLDETVVLTQRQSTVGPKATLLVVEGRTDRTQYQLSGPVAVIGNDAHATVKLRGWFAPRVAAQFNQHPSGYAIQPGPNQKELRVNGQSVETAVVLTDGDVIEVAGVKLSFYLSAQTQTTLPSPR